MTDNQLHDGFEDKELRDFFQIQLYESNFNKFEKTENLSNLRGLDWSIKNLENNIEKDNFILGQLKTKRSLLQLMKTKGWEEFDLSDFVTRVGDNWKSFIGTTNEYIKLRERLFDER